MKTQFKIVCMLAAVLTLGACSEEKKVVGGDADKKVVDVPLKPLRAQYSFLGNFKDSSDYGNHATASSSSIYTASNGIVGYVDLDGVDDYLEIPASETLQTQELTISVWVSPDGAVGASDTYSRNVINNYGSQYDFGLEMRSTAQNRWEIRPKVGFDLEGTTGSYEDPFISIPQTVAGSWIHLVLVRTKTFQIKTYANGVLLKTNDSVAGFSVAIKNYHNNPTNTVRIGRRHGTGTNFFDGKISDIRIIAEDLSDADVLALYNSTVANYSGL